MKAFCVMGRAAHGTEHDYTTEEWVVVVYFDREQAETHAKRAKERMMTDLKGKVKGSKLEQRYMNPFDQNLIMGASRDAVTYFVVEVEGFRHFDEYQEEKELV